MMPKLPVPTAVKPRVIGEARREDYALHFILRVRRAWNSMSPTDRHDALLAGAEQLEDYARQMRSEAEELER